MSERTSLFQIWHHTRPLLSGYCRRKRRDTDFSLASPKTWLHNWISKGRNCSVARTLDFRYRVWQTNGRQSMHAVETLTRRVVINYACLYSFCLSLVIEFTIGAYAVFAGIIFSSRFCIICYLIQVLSWTVILILYYVLLHWLYSCFSIKRLHFFDRSALAVV